MNPLLAIGQVQLLATVVGLTLHYPQLLSVNPRHAIMNKWK